MPITDKPRWTTSQIFFSSDQTIHAHKKIKKKIHTSTPDENQQNLSKFGNVPA